MLGRMFYYMKICINKLSNLYRNRYFLMILSRLPNKWIKWLKLSHLLIKPVNSVDKVLAYIRKNRRRLDESYKQDDQQLGLILEHNNPGGTFSINIEPEIYDKIQLNEELIYSENVLEKNWKRRMLIENTPRGNIYMYYDIFKHGFAYYADQSGIPYAILNAAAMKYVMVFYCRDFYMDEVTIPNNKGSPLVTVFFGDNEEDEKKKKREKNGIPDIDTKQGPFAKFKDYSKSASNSMKTMNLVDVKTNKNINNWFYKIKKWINSIFNQQETEVLPITNIKPAPEPMKEKMTNKFIYMGHVQNWQPLNRLPKKMRETKFATNYDSMFGGDMRISYKDWMDSVKNKNNVFGESPNVEGRICAEENTFENDVVMV